MDILQYLTALLKIRREIGIDGLGTFYKKKTPGRYDATSHSFLPPSHILQFSAEVTEHVNLTQYIQAKRGVSEDSASHFIGSFVADVNRALAQHGKHTLVNLGELILKDDQVSFTPTHQINIGFDFFALPAVAAAAPIISKIDDVVVKKALTEEENERDVSQTQQGEIAGSLGGEERIKNDDDPRDIGKEEVTADIEYESVTDSVVNETVDEQREDADIHEENTVTSTAEINEALPAEGNEKNYRPDENNVPRDFNNDDVISKLDLQEENLERHEVETSDDKGNLLADSAAASPSLANSTQRTDTHPAKEEAPNMPVYQKLGVALLIFLAIAFAVYLYNPNLFRYNQPKPEPKTIVPLENNTLKTQQDSLTFADSLMKNAEQAGLIVEAAKDTLQITATAVPVKTTTYEIIAAALASETEANKYIANMKRNGYDAKIAKNMPGKIYTKISIASYNSRESANKALKKLRIKLKNSDLYIFEDKNK